MRIKPTGLQDVLKRLEARTGIKCNAHAFRRTFACESVRNGLNVFCFQSLLGHSSLTMTRIYAEHVNSEDAIKAYKPIVTWPRRPWPQPSVVMVNRYSRAYTFDDAAVRYQPIVE